MTSAMASPVAADMYSTSHGVDVKPANNLRMVQMPCPSQVILLRLNTWRVEYAPAAVPARCNFPNQKFPNQTEKSDNPAATSRNITMLIRTLQQCRRP
jgi:hypothetical protein